jgi:hypothetical protein
MEQTGPYNPYAPPVAEVDAGPPDGDGLHRDGKLVRMGVGAPFPDRCLCCNKPAANYRAERCLYWRPARWRWTVGLSLVILFVVSGIDPLVTVLFLLAVVGFAIADIFVRRKVVVEYGLCERHRRVRSGVMGAFVANWVLVLGVPAVLASGSDAIPPWSFLPVAAAMFVLAIVASVLYRIRLIRISGDHMWLQGAGRPFYEGLPSANGNA